MQLQEVITPADTLIRAFQLQDGIFHNALADITDEQALMRPNDRTNHYNWLLGHVATCRCMLANAIGLRVENPHGDLYFKAIGDYHYRLWLTFRPLGKHFRSPDGLPGGLVAGRWTHMWKECRFPAST
ncbi:MAG: hypothetical protein IPK76_04790 [Lewinellaceae bacterium]|nr:hypothetical protein [Lewinellaceae bacterium]